MTGKRIFFTGGSGKAGRHVIPGLLERGHRVLNIDRVPLDIPGIETLSADITDPGQVFDAMSGHLHLSELDHGAPRGFDAVVHFAAIPRILLAPDAEVYRVNTLGTYNVLAAAAKLGIRKVIIASSETTYGICFSNGRSVPKSLPLDEDYDVDPMDAYGCSKVVGEVTARSLARRSGADIYALRLAYVVAPDEYPEFVASFRDRDDSRYRSTFSYLDARDLAQMVHLCLETDGLGFQIFNCAAADNASMLGPAELIERFYADVPIARPLNGDEPLYSIRKAQKVLGYRPAHSWRDFSS